MSYLPSGVGKRNMIKIGILALQGDFDEHQKMLDGLGINTIQVRKSNQLTNLDGLIIPGGESTTMGKLATDFQLMEDLRTFAMRHAVWGTCAGAILLSKNSGHVQPLLGVMDITTARNAFGRQVESFEIDLNVPALKVVDPSDAPFPAIFIRAPLIETTGPGVEILAYINDDQVVAVREDQWLATSFHPELSTDNRFHRYFLEMIQSK